MAVVNWVGPPTNNFDLRCAMQFIRGNYSVPVDGAVVGTNKFVGIIPKGASLPGTGMYFVTKVVGANTDTVALFLVPRATLIIDTTALIPTTICTATTTGQYFNTAANVKSAGQSAAAGHFDVLQEDYAAFIQYSAADATGTVGSWDVFIPFYSTFDLTT